MAISLYQGPAGSKVGKDKNGQPTLYECWAWAIKPLIGTAKKQIGPSNFEAIPMVKSRMGMAMAVIKRPQPVQPRLHAWLASSRDDARLTLSVKDIESLAGKSPTANAKKQQKGQETVTTWAANVLSVMTGTPMPGATPSLMAQLDSWHAEFETQWAAWLASEEGVVAASRVREGKDEYTGLDSVYDFETGAAVTARPQNLDALRDRAAAAAARLAGIKASAEAQAKVTKAFNAELAKAAAAAAEVGDE